MPNPSRFRTVLVAAIAAGLALGACVPLPGLHRRHVDPAPPASGPLDLLSFWGGTWYGIARTPSGPTRGCVAPRLDFTHAPDGSLVERDSCRRGSPAGREEAFTARAEVQDPPVNAELRTSYGFSGPLARPARTIRVVDHGPEEGGWFIASSPDFTDVSIYARAPGISPELKVRLVARIQAFGFDPARLEFPAQAEPAPAPPIGQR